MKDKLKNILHFFKKNRMIVILTGLLAVLVAVLVILLGASPDTNNTLASTQSTAGTTVTTEPTEETIVEEPTIYPEETIEFDLPEIETEYLQTDIYTTLDNNIFMDSLIYTGYNIEKHRADGNMWIYILAGKKRGLGYLSDIGYGGGSTGYETDKDGKPNIKKFEKSSLVCASFVTYVYFNYLPNVAGIDTSVLTQPERSISANSWYKAAQDWVKKGWSRFIDFDYKVYGAIGSSKMDFWPKEEIPLGSLIILCNPKKSMSVGAHVTVYAGHVNGYDWLYHVGTANGPEFSAVQRMNYGPNARWPLAIITPPNNLRFSPLLEIEVLDKAGKPVVGSEFTLKHPTSGKEISLGATDENGKITMEGLSYGDFILEQSVPEGYSCQSPSNEIKITGVNNSHNKVRIIITKEAA